MPRAKKPVEFQVQFKDSDTLFEIAEAQHPGDPDDPKVQKAREAFGKKYTDYWDYGRFAINPQTLETRLLPRKEWR